MNCPSRTDHVDSHPGWNQNPGPLSNDLTTRQDLNGIANLRHSKEHFCPEEGSIKNKSQVNDCENVEDDIPKNANAVPAGSLDAATSSLRNLEHTSSKIAFAPLRFFSVAMTTTMKPVLKRTVNLASFVGPGFLIAVAYIDPGNYSTDVSAGAATQYRLLFIVLMSNIFAVILQSLSIRLGTVTGMNLSEHCRAHLPKWLNLSIYVLAEAAIIATDIAEVSWHLCYFTFPTDLPR